MGIKLRISIKEKSGLKGDGFTIVELLIVIVVIGILAAISIVSYTGIQDRAANASLESDMTNIAKRMEMYKALNDEYPLPANLGAAFDGLKVNKSAYGNGVVTASGNHNLIYCVSSDKVQYGVMAWNKKGEGYGIKDGKPGKVNLAIAGSTTICPALVSPYASQMQWLLSQSVWASYL